MLQHFAEYLSGVRYLVCTYSKGPSTKHEGQFTVKIYEMYGSDIADEEVEYGAEDGATHIRLELRGIEAALMNIGTTTHPIVFLTRQKYIPDHAEALRSRDFKLSSGKPAANVDVWKRIAELDPNGRIEWRYADRDYDEMIEAWKEEKELDANMASALERDPY